MSFGGVLGVATSELGAIELGSIAAPANATWLVSAQNRLTFSYVANGYVPQARPVSASSLITLTPSATEYFIGQHFVSASSGVVLTPKATEGDAHVFLVSATSGLVLTPSPFGAKAGIYTVSASSGLVLTPQPRVAQSIYVVAANLLYVYASAQGYASPIPVSAVTQIILSPSCDELDYGPKIVSATTGLILSYSGLYVANRLWPVSATNWVTLSYTATPNAMHVVRAASGVILSYVGAQNRDIHPAAVTTVTFTPSPLTTNIKSDYVTSGVVFTCQAGLILTGTQAQNGLKFTTMAQAVVWIPWRQAALSLTPGGNLPHS